MNTCFWWHMFKSNIEKILSCLLVLYILHMLLIKELCNYTCSIHFNIDCKVKTSYLFSIPLSFDKNMKFNQFGKCSNLSILFGFPCLKKVILAKNTIWLWIMHINAKPTIFLKNWSKLSQSQCSGNTYCITWVSKRFVFQ